MEKPKYNGVLFAIILVLLTKDLSCLLLADSVPEYIQCVGDSYELITSVIN